MSLDPVEFTGCGTILDIRGTFCGKVIPVPDPFLPDTMAYDPILCDTCTKLFRIEVEDLLEEL